MATASDMLNSILASDATLTTLLPGGILDPDDVFRPGFTPENIPYAADGVTVQAFATVRWQSSDSFGPRRVAAERGSVEIFIYNDVGYTTIESAISRVKLLLNDYHLSGADDRKFVHFKSATISGKLTEEDFGGAPVMFIRFQITQTRR